MQKFHLNNSLKMPDGLEPSLTTERAKPPEYYQALRRQMLAIGSLTRAEKSRDNSQSQYLRSHAGDTIRNNMAEANLKTKL